MSEAVRVVDLIELHDSVVEFRRLSNEIVLDLRPAYVHHWEDSGSGWIGTGRSQDARIEIATPAAPRVLDGLIDVSDGFLQLENAGFDMIPAPLEASGSVRVQLQLVDGTSVTIDGSNVRVELVGPAEDLEPLPSKWAPDVDAV